MSDASHDIVPDDGEFTTGNGQQNHICPKCKAHCSSAADAAACCAK